MSYEFSQTLTEDNRILNLTSGGGHGLGQFGERFACAVCGKSYLRKRHLQRHMRDECIGIPPRFSCDLCPSRFRRKYHMVRHLTSKHGIPAAIAQQTTGNRSGSSSMMGGGGHKKEMGDGPENLTMRKENYEAEHLTAGHLHQHHLQQLGGGGSSPSHITSGDSGSDCNGGGTAGTSPIPPAHIMPMPTYGLTGAITAISAAAAHVEEKDAKILLEAAAAAAAAHAAATASAKANNANNAAPEGSNNDNLMENNENRNANDESSAMRVNGMEAAGAEGAGALPPTPPQPPASATSTSTADKEDNTTSVIKSKDMVKTEPLTPNKTAALSMLDDEWKMKLSLQLISNSLLKERLMNTHLPFAYNNN